MSCVGSSNIPSNKGKEIMAEEHGNGNGRQLPPRKNSSAANEEAMPAWLKQLLKTRFWEPCAQHTVENRAEECLFCLFCHEAFCPHCTHDEPGHNLLKVRRYVYRSVVLAKDMHELNVDVSRIQTYVINGQRGVHLRPMKRSKLFRPQAGAPRCLTCRCWLRTAPNLFCSLTCKGRVKVSQDDFSGPEAERRYRSLQANLLAPLAADEDQLTEPEAEPEPPAPEPVDAPPVANPPAAPKKGSFRRRARKQAEPLRAPFF